MHLKQLKLAGFKSFVDKSILSFPSQLVGILGPNGCGKSNIIDALRWVMGESSAKTLRGDSMTDVIFNGSSTRKSLGQASVELVFDNSLGRIGGQFASYQEISLKRVVSRDGDSAYYLNNSRCRRRDIQDIFLGTGAGSKGYAIIGQDMISRIIEARPEDLRSYIEEAAGVSKYKERRRETVLRIAHTREHLERIADISQELGKNLAKLERQAKTAERYKSLREQERQDRIAILLMKERDLEGQLQQCKENLQSASAGLEMQQSRLCNLQNKALLSVEALKQAESQYQSLQALFYQAGNEMTRIEEAIQSQKKEQSKLSEDKQLLQNDWQDAYQEELQSQEQLQEALMRITELQASAERLQLEFAAQEQQLRQKNQQLSKSNQAYLETQQLHNQIQQDLRVETIHQEHRAQRRQQIHNRHEALNQEKQQQSLEQITLDIESLLAEEQSLKQHQQNLQETSQKAKASLEDMQKSCDTLEGQLRKSQDSLLQLKTEEAVLAAAQQAALKTVHKPSENADWASKPRLVELLQVEESWLSAAELVLADSLQAVVLDSFDNLLPRLSELRGQSAVFVTASQVVEPAQFPRLCDKIQGLTPSWRHALEDIFAAEHLDQALEWLPQLEPQQSIISKDGYWLGKAWLMILNMEQDSEQGLLNRQKKLVQIQETLALAEKDFLKQKENREQIAQLLPEHRAFYQKIEQDLQDCKEALRGVEFNLKTRQSSLSQGRLRQEKLEAELLELQDELENLGLQESSSLISLGAAREKAAFLQEQLEQLTKAKSNCEEEQQRLQQNFEETRNALQRSELHLSQEKQKIEQLQRSIQRAKARLEALTERLEVLNQRQEALQQADADYEPRLQEKLQAYQQLEQDLALSRQQIEQIRSENSEQEAAVRGAEQAGKGLLEQIQELKMQEQALTIHQSSLLGMLKELDWDRNSKLEIDPSTSLQESEAALLLLQQKIQSLGAINLLAIEEYQAESSRKEELDAQQQDLNEALTLLETAMDKIDKETQSRFLDTFNDINEAFKKLFPRLFGGGRAMLELTCDNLLETGVLVMAQPPGKRNSSIQLLSGGEKAMAAVSLIFAMFQLNPAPFCLLDEVDAPLDDANVRRLSELIKEMSEQVQFIFITHNKISMEMADHLIGVTMREPGVSRIVAVDVKEALAE